MDADSLGRERLFGGLAGRSLRNTLVHEAEDHPSFPAHGRCQIIQFMLLVPGAVAALVLRKKELK